MDHSFIQDFGGETAWITVLFRTLWVRPHGSQFFKFQVVTAFLPQALLGYLASNMCCVVLCCVVLCCVVLCCVVLCCVVLCCVVLCCVYDKQQWVTPVF